MVSIKIAENDAVGISFGVSKFTLDKRVKVMLDSSNTPKDLLIRIAQNKPIISVDNDKGRVTALDAREMFVQRVAETLTQQRIDTLTTPTGLAIPGWWSPSTISQVKADFTKEGLNILLVNDAEAAVTQFQTEILQNQTESQTLPDTLAVLYINSVFVSVVIVTNCALNDSTPLVALAYPNAVIEEGADLLDRQVLQHLISGMTDLGDVVETSSSETVLAAKDALVQCRKIRESLSTRASETFFSTLPGSSHQIRFVRSELEQLAKPWADSIVDTLQSVIKQCDKAVAGVLITGGVSKMPLISQRISADLGLNVFVSNDPQHLVAKGCKEITISAHKKKKTNRGIDFLLSFKNFFFKTKKSSLILTDSGPTIDQAEQQHIETPTKSTVDFLNELLNEEPDTEPIKASGVEA